MSALIFLLVLASTIWIGIDASKRDWTGNRFANATWQWIVGSLFLWILALPAYLAFRHRAPLKAAAGPPFPPASAPDGWLPPSAGSIPPPPSSVPPPPPRG